MKSILFLAQKGGSGKTTLAVHIAVAAGEKGERVALVDTDPQGSASAWERAREKDEPLVAHATASQVAEVQKAADDEQYSMLIIDTAPHSTPAATATVGLADFILIPCRPTAFDLAAISASANIVKAAGKPAAFVLNACPPRAPEIEEAKVTLVEYGLRVAPITIGDRRAFSRAIASGRAVTEFESRGKAAQEIRALWKWVKGEL
jgi:chromosome partitioning protein